jgi:hypothetical protein
MLHFANTIIHDASENRTSKAITAKGTGRKFVKMSQKLSCISPGNSAKGKLGPFVASFIDYKNG